MSLTPLEVKNARYGEGSNKRPDGQSLYLWLKPNGRKYWLYRYRFAGKENSVLLGSAEGPKAITLAAARRLRDAERQKLQRGQDPSGERKASKARQTFAAINTFGAIAEEWFLMKSGGLAGATISKKRSFLDADILPALGTRLISELQTPELLALLRRIETRGAHDVAKRCKGIITRIFAYAIQTGRASTNPAASLIDVLSPKQVKHRPSLTQPDEIAKLLRDCDGYSGTPATCAALKLAPLFFQRPGEMRLAQWTEFDLDAAMWVIPKTRMKKRPGYETDAHFVPLATQAVAILRQLQNITGTHRHVFCASTTQDKPISENTINQAMHRLGYKGEQTAHGFRAMARTVADEVLGIRKEWLEAQLAHAVKDFNGRAYQRMAFIEQRKQMMQQWADYLDRLKAGAVVIGLAGHLKK